MLRDKRPFIRLIKMAFVLVVKRGQIQILVKRDRLSGNQTDRVLKKVKIGTADVHQAETLHDMMDGIHEIQIIIDQIPRKCWNEPRLAVCGDDLLFQIAYVL